MQKFSVTSPALCVLQVNTISLWKFSFKKSEDIEPQMTSEARVDGSVMDIEVRVLLAVHLALSCV